jgi:Response regulator containing a CheY-like receiver domain and an HTH DNA-binding domain
MRTNMQQTSLDTYWDIESKLGNRQVKVLEFLSHWKYGLTNNEIARELGIPINQITPRVFELRQKGLVEEACKRSCSVTGRTALVWIVR